MVSAVLQLEKAGHRCTSIRGDLDHQLRDRVVNEFRTGITKILIATDVLSRGFDVTQVRAGCLDMCSQHVRGNCLLVLCYVGRPTWPLQPNHCSDRMRARNLLVLSGQVSVPGDVGHQL